MRVFASTLVAGTNSLRRSRRLQGKSKAMDDSAVRPLPFVRSFRSAFARPLMLSPLPDLYSLDDRLVKQS